MRVVGLVAFVLILLSITQPQANAKWGTFTVTDDKGDQVIVKHGLLGKKVIVKDRYGNGVGHSRSIFGLTKNTEVSAAGNDVNVHKGLFGFGHTDVKDMLGDTATSKKNLLFRNTNVNLSGANSFMSKILAPKSAIPVSPDAAGQAGVLPDSPARTLAPLVDTSKFSGPPTQSNQP